MARKRTGGAVSAARSAAAKKGWETRRRGGAAAKPAGGGKTAATRPTKSKAKPAAAPARAPKTTTARGRARTKAAEARKALKAGGGTRAARSLRTAQRAADYYKATGTGTKRSRTGGSGGSKPAKAAAAKPARGKGGAKPATQRSAAKPIPRLSRDQRIQANEAKMAGVKLAAYDLRSKLPKKKRDSTGRSTVGGLLLKISGREISRQQYGAISDLIGPRGIQGVRTRMNANGSITLSMSSVAKAQATIGEKLATRPRRRRRR